MRKWYYQWEGELPQGPVSAAELRCLAASGQLQPTDQVWAEGTENWVSASRVRGLFPDPSPGRPVKPQRSEQRIVPLGCPRDVWRQTVFVSSAQAGQQIPCPHCRQLIMIPGPSDAVWALPMPPVVSEPVEVSPIEPPLSPGWRAVCQGLGWVRAGLAASFVAFTGLCAFLLGGWLPGLGILVTLWLLAAVPAALLGALLLVVGKIYCCAAPAEAGVRGWAIGAAACILAVLSLALANLVLLFPHLGQSLETFPTHDMTLFVILVSASVLSLLARVLFLLFLRGVADFFSKQSLSAQITQYFWKLLFYLGGCLFLPLLILGTAVLVPEEAMQRQLLQLVTVTLIFVWLLWVVLGEGVLLLNYRDLVHGACGTVGRAISRFGLDEN